MLAFAQLMTQDFKIHFKFNAKLRKIDEKRDESKPFGIFTVLKRGVEVLCQFLRTETAYWCLLAYWATLMG